MRFFRAKEGPVDLVKNLASDLGELLASSEASGRISDRVCCDTRTQSREAGGRLVFCIGALWGVCILCRLRRTRVAV